MNRTLLFLFTCICLYSCKRDETIPKDFNLYFEFNKYFAPCELSTSDSSFKADVWLGEETYGDSVLKLTLSHDELKRIYYTLTENDYMTLHDTVFYNHNRPDLSEICLIVNANSKQKHIYSLDSISNYGDFGRLNRINDTIMKILTSKKNVQDLINYGIKYKGF